jgi:hypothetical protein
VDGDNQITGIRVIPGNSDFARHPGIAQRYPEPSVLVPQQKLSSAKDAKHAKRNPTSSSLRSFASFADRLFLCKSHWVTALLASSWRSPFGPTSLFGRARARHVTGMTKKGLMRHSLAGIPQ